MQEQFIDHLQINNYKSVKNLSIKCSRINVLIGEPNVGKSNILEALDLSFLPWMLHQNQSNSLAGKEGIDILKYFRINKAADLFSDGDISREISILHPGFSYSTRLHFQNQLSSNKTSDSNFFELTGGASFTRFDNDFRPLPPEQYFGSPIKPFRFKDDLSYHDTGNYLSNLMPPFGNNLIQVIQYNSAFRSFVGELIQDFDLELNIDETANRLFVQKRRSPGVVFSMKYESIADTLRRVIFYTAAIRFGGNFVVTLEEPDAHSFPKYVSFLADEIIEQRNIQFFIATHNPYLLNNLIENTPDGELAVFVCGFNKEKGTTAYKLSKNDLSELLDYGVDIFFNINKYSDDRVEHNS